MPSAGKDHLGLAVLQTVDDDEVGAPAGCDEAAVAKTEGACGRNRGGAIDGERLDSRGNRRAYHVVEMTLFGDVERITIVRAERQIGRQPLGDDRHQSIQVLGDGALAHENVHALADLFERFLCACALMVGPNAGREITVQFLAAKQGRMAVDVPILEGVELGEANRILMKDAREVHEFGKPDHLRMVAEGDQALDRQVGTSRLEMRRRHARGKLDADVHHRFQCRVQEKLDAFGAEHIGDLVRIADRRGDAERQDAAVELVRGDERGFDVQMRIDEAGDDDAAADVDFLTTFIVAASADDTVARDRDVRDDQFAGDEIEEASPLEHDVRGFAANPLIDEPFQRFGHARNPALHFYS